MPDLQRAGLLDCRPLVRDLRAGFLGADPSRRTYRRSDNHWYFILAKKVIHKAVTSGADDSVRRDPRPQAGDPVDKERVTERKRDEAKPHQAKCPERHSTGSFGMRRTTIDIGSMTIAASSIIPVKGRNMQST
ncbi:hypothetical protein [Agrobacterium deltaense]|uniref:hypothetical protein n=1 Tax=Agrobacterium deltaense TaxID=1183412 RepID=UPI0013C42E76|nr:hypothetical protein [Agrobacterium deltaense]